MPSRKERREQAAKKREELAKKYTDYVKKKYEETKDLKVAVDSLYEVVNKDCKKTPQEAALYREVLAMFLQHLLHAFEECADIPEEPAE